SATIKATIIDFSDVEAVTGKVVDAGNAEHSIGFTFADDLYTSIFPTTPESPIGIYRAEITGTDENGFSSTASKTFEVVHNYFIGITVNPATATPGQQVQATGTVRRDDGTVPEETSIILKLPDGTEQQTSLDTATGSYSLTFQAPGHDGNYEVQAIFNANNGVAYTIKTTLVVATPASDAGSTSGGGSRGLRGLGPSAGPGSSVGGTTSTSTSSTAPSSPAASSASQGEGAADGGAITGGPTGVAGTGSGAGKITGAAVSGVGRAASLFSLSALRTGRFWWTVFALVFLITVLIALGRRGQFHNEIEVEEEASKEQNGLSDWDNYLENLSKRR
ncbi:hypothetical protein HYS48_03870, partial [Candidatus Woesearchaeota archaeon]|nr:hypothetical protein [Candidatus Woesearchaeota archaeon]